MTETFNGDAYCVMCKEKRDMKNGVIKVSDSGRRMAAGVCPICGTKMNRILGKLDYPTDDTFIKQLSREQQLVSRGYLTIDEFLDRLIPGLRDYLHENWSASKQELHHPEDLFSNASIYLDVALRVVGDFGVNNGAK